MPAFDFWPSPHQELLLTAALGTSEAALRAWQEWQSRETIAAADAGSQRLMPLVYFNLARSGLTGPSIAALKVTYMHARMANQHRLSYLSGLLQLFASHEIPTLLLKGAALTLQTYRDPGLRPMGDLDVAVPHRFAEQAIRILTENDWLSESVQEGQIINPEFCAALQFHDPLGFELDLHFSPFHDYSPFFRKRLEWETVMPFWSAAMPLRVDEYDTLTLSTTDHLLHTLEHGAVANEIAPIRWVADALWLLRGDRPIAWNQFIARAAALQLSLVASRTLAYLRDRHGAAVPAEVIKALKRWPSALELLEYSSRRNQMPRWIAARKCWALYAMQHPGRRNLKLAIGFIDYLKLRWSARNWNELFWIALKRVFFVTR